MYKKNSNPFPKISIITPSYNQKYFLEKTILSVLNQNYPNFELIIIDGGSTDGSVDIIKKYENSIEYWVSEKDLGQTNAINKGLKIATGEWVCWQNSDDIFINSCFFELAKIINNNPELNLIFGNLILIDHNDNFIRNHKYVKPNFNSIFHEGMVISNQCAFWNLKVHEEIGFLNENYSYAFDFEWFLRLTKLKKIKHINSYWGAFRIQPNAKTVVHPERYKSEFQLIKLSYGKKFNLKYIYKIRRLFLMIFSGNLLYLLNSFFKKAF
jgi:glycosyltransferase involved in cell wall biosynthesis